MLSNIVRRMFNPVVGYLFLLLGFVFLGLTVAALALQSDLAALFGVALAVSLMAAVLGFRIGAAKLAEVGAGGDSGHNVSIWSRPIRQVQVDQYNVNFRGEQRRPASAAGAEVLAAPAPVRATRPSRGRWETTAVPTRLSA